MGTEHLLKQDHDWPHSLPIMFSRQALSLRASARKTVAARSAIQQQTRKLSIHEYLSVKLLNQYGVLTPESKAAHSPEEAYEVAKSFPTNELVIKAQVLAGGRGKGHFDSGLQGGVKMIESPEEARDLAKQMIGSKLITKQTGAGGRLCNAVMLARRIQPTHEYYLAILNDRGLGGPALVASARGGMNIEDVARDEPDAIITHPINFENGLNPAEGKEIAQKLGFKDDKAQEQAADIMAKLYKLFKETDATQVEAAEYGLNFIKLDGNIGCLVNGAGLAMATMD